jgi:hypothetical protein
MRAMRRRFALLPAAIVAGCSQPPARPIAAAHPPAPVLPYAPPPPPVAVDWRDRPATPGTWTYQQDARGSVAMFGTPGQDALVVLRCDQAGRRLFLSRGGAATGAFTVRTSSTTRRLPAGATGGVPPYAAALIPATDPLLDAIAFSRGRFALDEDGQPPLTPPAWAEVGRVIEDCRG